MSTVTTDTARNVLVFEQLASMVEPDQHRRGRAFGRLVAEQIPIWPLIGLARHYAGSRTPNVADRTLIEAVAKDYDISVDAVQAAFLYYLQNRNDIDAWLDANAAE